MQAAATHVPSGHESCRLTLLNSYHVRVASATLRRKNAASKQVLSHISKEAMRGAAQHHPSSYARRQPKPQTGAARKQQTGSCFAAHLVKTSSAAHLKKDWTFSTFVCGGLLATLPLFPLGFFFRTCRVTEDFSRGITLLSAARLGRQSVDLVPCHETGQSWCAAVRAGACHLRRQALKDDLPACRTPQFLATA